MPSGNNKIVRRLTRGQLYLEEMSLDVGNIFRDFRNKLLESSRESTPIIDGGNLRGITVTGSKSAKYNMLYNKNRRRVNRKTKFGMASGVTGLAASPLVLAFANYNSDNRLLRSMDNLEKQGIIARDSLGYIDMYKEDYNKLLPKLKELVDKYMKMINQHEFKHNNPTSQK